MKPHPTPDLDTTVPPRRDAGFTLPEMLIAMVISGILVVSISMAFTTVLQTQSQASDRLAESKDITFVQTWMPVDLSSALETFNSPSDAEILVGLAALNPPMSIRALAPGGPGLPGTNVITLVRPDLDAGAGVYYIIAYRYHEIDGQWQVSRFEIKNPGTASEVIKVVGVAHEVPAPPVGWNPTMSPIHAVEVTARNQVILRPIGENVTFNFESGNKFISGGAGLSAENQLPSDGSGGLQNPSAPPSRCGGRMALVIDSSGSVNPFRTQAIAAAKSFITSFSGTPYSLTLNEFNTTSFGMIGTNGRQENRAPYVSLLNGGAAVAGLNTRVDNMVFDGFTNWADGFRVALSNNNGTRAGAPIGVDQPDLLVFITDGEPNRIRSATGAAATANATVSTTAAANLADAARRSGTETIGIMVGSAGDSSTAMRRLLDVAGGVGSTNLWRGTISPTGVVTDIGNAANADVFKGSFDQLGGILKSIMIAECGGTLTVQKRIQTAPGVVDVPATGKFTFVTSLGDRVLDRDVTSSVTFDFTFAPGTATKTVEIRETTPGYRFLRAECSAGGVSVAATPLADGTAGVAVTVSVDKAVSCLMISEPNS